MSPIPSLTGLRFERPFLALASSTQDLVILTDLRQNIIFVNDGAAGIAGFDRNELLGAPIRRLFGEKQARSHAGLIERLAKAKRPWHGSLALRAKDGSPVDVDLSIELIYDSRGEPAGLLSVGKDARVQHERSQRPWEEYGRLLSICESMEDGVAVCSQQGAVLMCNDAYARKLGYDKRDVVGTTLPYPWTDLVNAERMRTALRLFLKERSLSNHLIAVQRKDGSTAIVSLGLAPFRNNGRATSKIVMNVRDVTDVQYAQEARRASDQLYRLQLEVKRKAQRLQTLQEINAFVLNNADVDLIFKAITTGIKNLVGHDLAGIYLYDPDRELFFAHTLSKQTPFSRRLAKFPLPIGVGILGMAAISGKMVWVNNAQLDPRSRYPKGMRPEKEHFIAVPLKGRNSIFGILVVARNRDPEFIEEEANIVRSFADAATVALENAQLHHELKLMPEETRRVLRPPSIPGSRSAQVKRDGLRAGGRRLSRETPPPMR